MGALAALWGITRRTGPGALYPLTNPVTALVSGHPKGGYTLLCGTLGVICTVRVIAGFAQGMLLRQRQMQAMKSSAQAVQEKFEQAQATLRQILRTVPDRVHTILPGLAILNAVLKSDEVETVLVSTCGVREGYLLQRVMGVNGHE